jgi:Holliday junction resolvasome RuvABC endonuclease subunit
VTAVIGLDLSLTSTGICNALGTCFTVKGKADAGDARLVAIGEAIEFFPSAQLAVIEDLYPGARGGVTTAMVQGVARYVLRNMGIPYALVSPTSLKLYATGSGAADKTAMALAAYKRTEVEFANDDECDAWWLRAMGLDAIREPLFELPASHRKALTKVAWPVLP